MKNLAKKRWHAKGNYIQSNLNKHIVGIILQGVSWELTKSISFMLGPGGIPEAKTGGNLSKIYILIIGFKIVIKFKFAFRIQVCLN